MIILLCEQTLVAFEGDEARSAYEAAVTNEANYALDATVDMDAIKAWLAAN